MHRLPRAIRLRQQHFVAPRVFNRLAQRHITSRGPFRNIYGEPAKVQAVRFKKPGFTTRRLATIGIYIGAGWAYLNLVARYLDIEIEMLDEMDEEEAQNRAMADHEEESEYAEEDSLFIPMTWAKKTPRTFYKGSDPEWQEFTKIAQDKQRHKKIQDELVQIVFTGAQRHPAIKNSIGKDAKIGKFWMDVQFPDGPPQEYERSGIEIGDGFIAWSQQRISPESQWRLTRALWPKAAFDSLWATTKVLVGINYRRAKQALGWEDKDPFSPEERYKHTLEMMQKQQQTRERKEVGKAQLEPDGNPGAVVGSSATSDSQPSRPTANDGKKSPWHLLQVPLPPSTGTSNSTDMPIAMAVFSSTLSKHWNPQKMEPPKGTFVVSGIVEVRGSVGRMLFDVQSCYDPKEAKFVVVKAGVRNFKRWKQSPRGGP